jgi:hypothetical protein
LHKIPPDFFICPAKVRDTLLAVSLENVSSIVEPAEALRGVKRVELPHDFATVLALGIDRGHGKSSKPG